MSSPESENEEEGVEKQGGKVGCHIQVWNEQVLKVRSRGFWAALRFAIMNFKTVGIAVWGNLWRRQQTAWGYVSKTDSVGREWQPLTWAIPFSVFQVLGLQVCGTTPDPAENTLGKLLLVLTGQASILNTRFGHMDVLSQWRAACSWFRKISHWAPCLQGNRFCQQYWSAWKVFLFKWTKNNHFRQRG